MSGTSFPNWSFAPDLTKGDARPWTPQSSRVPRDAIPWSGFGGEAPDWRKGTTTRLWGLVLGLSLALWGPAGAQPPPGPSGGEKSLLDRAKDGELDYGTILALHARDWARLQMMSWWPLTRAPVRLLVRVAEDGTGSGVVPGGPPLLDGSSLSAARHLAKHAPAAHARLERWYGRAPASPVDVYVVTHAPRHLLSRGSSYLSSNAISLVVDGPNDPPASDRELLLVYFVHELSHVFAATLVGPSASRPGAGGPYRAWLSEGVADYLAVTTPGLRPLGTYRAELGEDLLRSGFTLPFARLDEFATFYASGHSFHQPRSFFVFVAEKYGDRAIQRFARDSFEQPHADLDRLTRAAFGRGMADLEHEWLHYYGLHRPPARPRRNSDDRRTGAAGRTTEPG
ncbi:MAG: hypothetical protein HY814_03095 [Candidatus Riflebacteria bacterium]|nr:hypothetical protein [Candidatus Riflebacteria bacterium]